MKDLVSVVIANYNGSKYLSEAIDSVISQTYRDWELIVVDDGSTDESVSIVSRYVKRFPDQIFLYRNSINKGVVYTRNRGADLARGNYLAFLDADDVWMPEKLERQLTHMNNASLQACVTGMEAKNEPGISVQKKLFYESFMNNFKVNALGTGEVEFERLLVGNYPLLSSFVVSRDFFYAAGRFEKCGNYNCEDAHFFYKTTMLSTLGFIREKLTIYRLHKDSYSYRVYYRTNMDWDTATRAIWKKLSSRSDMFPAYRLKVMEIYFFIPFHKKVMRQLRRELKHLFVRRIC